MRIVKIFSLISLTFVFNLLGCGGGTSGTDGGTNIKTLKIVGRVLNENNSPLQSTELSVLESGDQASTDINGYFSLNTELDKQEVTFIVKFEDNETTTNSIVILPDDNGIAYIDVTLDTRNFTATVEALLISPNTPTAQSTANSRPTTNNEEALIDLRGKIISDRSAPIYNAVITFNGQKERSSKEGKFRFLLKSGNTRSNVLTIKIGKIVKRIRLPKLPEKSSIVTFTIRIVFDEKSAETPGEIGISGEPTKNQQNIKEIKVEHYIVKIL